MKRLVPLLGAVLALALCGTAGADTFSVVHTHHSQRTVTFAPYAAVTPSSGLQSGPMSFDPLRGIWQAAGNAYGIPWEVLAAINKVETNFGSNLGPSSAGAVGWMQFMPSTWARWGIDANGDGVADPNNPTDAIFSAARYLAGCGGQFDIARAVYCYNHADWYVNEVLALAAQYGRDGGSGFFPASQVKAQLASTRRQVKESKAQLAVALAQARRLGHAERRFVHRATTAPLLSDQLEARKHAVLLGVRRHAADLRVSRLRKLLHTATARLTTPELLAPPMYAGSNPFSGITPASTAPYSGVVSIALQYLGIPYVWGGANPSGFDCSGLVQYVYAQVGVSLPHYTVSQWNYPDAVPVPQNELQPGDLVFFNGLDHVGIYIGNGYFVDSPHTGADVRIDSFSERWYATKYDGAKRIVGTEVGGLPQTGGTTAFTRDRKSVV